MFKLVYQWTLPGILMRCAGAFVALFGCISVFTFLESPDWAGLLAPVILICGILLFFFGRKVNDMVFERRFLCALRDPRLNELIRDSALAAFSFFQNAPCEEMLKYIAGVNPFCAARLGEFLHRKISFDEMILALRRYDEIGKSAEPKPQERREVLYRNKVFVLKDPSTAAERRATEMK